MLSFIQNKSGLNKLQLNLYVLAWYSQGQMEIR